VRWITPGKPVTDADTADATVTYAGKAITVQRPR
jgi:alpha-D-xyloside xylohydrolase